MKSLTYIEIDIPFCVRTYGVSPCTASIPATGAYKCFNTRKTCQDRAHYLANDVTLRFAKPAAYRPRDIDAIPSIIDVSFTPATISLGENLGGRATLQVTFKDHPDSDTWSGLDKYVGERDYNPFKRGTFWGKFRARQPFLQELPIRWITGLLGQDIEEMQTRHFVIESFDGPTPDGKYTLIAKDILKLADGDRSQAPVMNTGYMVSAITASSDSLTLSPAGIGNAQYNTSGHLVLGGNEIVRFSRTGDLVSLAERGKFGTAAVAHNAQDRVQTVLQYIGEDPAIILYSLLTNFAGVPAEYCDLGAWQQEVSLHLGRVYTANICEPTAAATLISELIQQACLSVWWDDEAQQVRLKVLRAVTADVARFTPDNTLQGTLTTREQPEKRISEVWTYFAPINPTKPLSNTDNFRSVSVVKDANAEEDYGTPIVRKIYSRWIADLGRAIADRVGQIQLSRYRDPPRRVTFDLPRYDGIEPEAGVGYRIEAQNLQDETGAPSDVPVQITRLDSPPDRFRIEAEEVLFTAQSAPDLSNRLVIIDANIINVNLRTAHDANYPPAVSGDVVTCVINSGVLVGSSGPGGPALNIGDWAVGVTVRVKNYGRIQGAGGVGGVGGNAISGGLPAERGGTAIYARRAFYLENYGMSAGGGGGGGGGAVGSAGGGGGGGAGFWAGAGNRGGFGNEGYHGGPGGAATLDGPGTGGSAGAVFVFDDTFAQGGGGAGGGTPGSSGGTGARGNGLGAEAGGPGGDAGHVIDGSAFAIITYVGDMRGSFV